MMQIGIIYSAVFYFNPEEEMSKSHRLLVDNWYVKNVKRQGVWVAADDQ